MNLIEAPAGLPKLAQQLRALANSETTIDAIVDEDPFEIVLPEHENRPRNREDVNLSNDRHQCPER